MSEQVAQPRRSAESGQELVRFLEADHATVGGNQKLADQVRATFPCLNILVNNVGGLYQRRWETPTATKPSTLSRLGRS